MSTSLTVTQQAVLTHAHEHAEGKIVWFPDTIKGGARQKVIDGLANRGLITSKRNNWFISAAGYEALGVPRKGRVTLQAIDAVIKTTSVSADAPTIEKLQEAERQSEIWRQERLAEEERRRQEDDRRNIAQSIKESRDQLEQVIQAWSKVISLEQFFRGVEDRAQPLSEVERESVLDRLQLAREFVGSQNPLDFFRAWQTPVERYVPLSMRGLSTQPRCADNED